jgi:hypothetical protein
MYLVQAYIHELKNFIAEYKTLYRVIPRGLYLEPFSLLQSILCRPIDLKIRQHSKIIITQDIVFVNCMYAYVLRCHKSVSQIVLSVRKTYANCHHSL